MNPPPIPPAQPLDAAFVEREYNNRALVPAYPQFFARWERDSDFVRRTLVGHVNLHYGPDARHRVDLFPARESNHLLVFIHGGYWRGLDKSMFAWLASSWVAAGVGVALINYRLCPQVTIEDIVHDAITGTNWVMANAGRYSMGSEHVLLSGHSAGGHLTAALLAAPQGALLFDTARIVGGVVISGICDFAPLRLFGFNSDFRLDEGSVERLNLYDKAQVIDVPLVIAAGGAESGEFQRQARLLAHAWKPNVNALQIQPSLDHFSIVDTFAERGQPLYEASLALFPARPPL
jgi:arylformamidase